ncbi:cytosine/adenosine deaminase-related metal-dependent hydrolase [Haloactinopolyspora alba]|uniref:Cytosine/adenosine deaminase-related metal-dependent hydrolase n=1 Tax=Haloactinopolyspora alba TaxID=648780 RepID=A0A2P8DVM1_9ACTN|nr:8-oxoguanine deaminase [Haloactinopolyspora alba]PSL01288.1 cytosine/adenosine deaminase-related metal-dependent hydrolase [Haloactinopolyspora alba]
MSSLRLHSIDLLATMTGAEIGDGALLVRDGWIEKIGTTSEITDAADESVDLSGHVVLPGLVNTHQHLWQSLARAVPAAQDAALVDWLMALFPLWEKLTPDGVRTAGRLGAAGLALSGCTTVADHHYVWPNGIRMDDLVDGVAPVGVRAHLTRGGMSVGASQGGLAADVLTEREDAIVDATERAVSAFHDPEAGAMMRIAAGPPSVLSTSAELMRELGALAREHGIGLHTHLAETAGESERCVAAVGAPALPYLESLGWSGEHVWFAHAVHLAPDEIRSLAGSGTGVAHCPTSNMRLGSGIAPLGEFLREGVRVGLGVDGAASNDSTDMFAEVRQAMLLARVMAGMKGMGGIRHGSAGHRLLTARQMLRLATAGGAEVLSRDDIGTLAPGKAADIVAVDLDRLRFAGQHDPLAALVLCGTAHVDQSWVHGRRVVEDGRLRTVDVDELTAEHRARSAELTA